MWKNHTQTIFKSSVLWSGKKGGKWCSDPNNKICRGLSESEICPGYSVLSVTSLLLYYFIFSLLAPPLTLAFPFHFLSEVRRYPHSFEAWRPRQATVPHHHGSHHRRRSLLSGGSLFCGPAQQKVTNAKPGIFLSSTQHSQPPCAPAVPPLGTHIYVMTSHSTIITSVFFVNQMSTVINIMGKRS